MKQTEKNSEQIDLQMSQLRSEQMYYENYTRGIGRKQKKSDVQVAALKMYFDRFAVWDYQLKVEMS